MRHRGQHTDGAGVWHPHRSGGKRHPAMGADRGGNLRTSTQTGHVLSLFGACPVGSTTVRHVDVRTGIPSTVPGLGGLRSGRFRGQCAERGDEFRVISA